MHATMAIVAGLLPAGAWDAGPPVLPEEVVDGFRELAIRYANDSNPLLQEFKLRGRYHGQYQKTDADRHQHGDWEDRRTRIGFDAKLFRKQCEVRAEIRNRDDFGQTYDGLVDAYVRWVPSESFRVTAGKTKALVGQYDWLESTNTQPTFERSQIFNQLQVNRATALTVEGSQDHLEWRAGLYSNQTPASAGGSGRWGDGEFGKLDGGLSWSFGLGCDFKERLGLDKAELRVDWLHSERNPTDMVLGRYGDIVSATWWLEQDRWALVMEGYHASGGSGANSNVGGFFIQPTYDLVPDRIQLVGRYSFAMSQGSHGVIPQIRYESPEGANRGDMYHALYLGAQYFLHGDRLKLMTGAEMFMLGSDAGGGYDGVTVFGGVRWSF